MAGRPAIRAAANAAPAFPLKASSNKRYLVDQNNVPFLMVGDSPQGMMAIQPSDAATYLANRQAAGINTLWIDLLCSTYSGVCPSINSYNGTPPFTTAGDLSTPNPTYFAQADSLINLAAQYGMLVVLAPIETGYWLPTLRANGTTKAYNFGVYVGNRYKNFPNIIWLHGDDFQTWTNSTDDAVVSAVARGIQSVDPNHLQTVELDFPTSASLNDPTWVPLVGLDSAYSYFSPYDQLLREYNRSGYIPVYFLEGVYEYQTYSGGYTGPHELRAQEYWTLLSGAAGHVYGNANLYGFPSGWKNSNWQTSPGFTQLIYMRNFFAGLAWYNLVPDQNHALVTAGYGTYQSITAGVQGNTSDYATAARTPDGSLAIVYMPTARTITVNMAQMSAAATARWYDPTRGSYTTLSGSPFSNSGSRQFTPPGTNGGGDSDWVLILQTSAPAPTPTPIATATSTPRPTATPAATSTPAPGPTATPAATSTPAPKPTSTPAATSTPVSAPGLLAAYGFNENGGTSAHDASGNGYNGTLVSGPTWVTPGRTGAAALHFASGQDVSTGLSSALAKRSQLTWSAWIKRDAAGGQVEIGEQSGTYLDGITLEAYKDGNVYCFLSSGNSPGSYGYFALNDTNWHHVACVFDGTQTGNSGRLKAYLDGNPKTLTYNGTIPATTTSRTSDPFLVGRVVGDYSQGTVDDVRVYTTVRSQSQIQSDMNTAVP
jgi:hypothetical protein